MEMRSGYGDVVEPDYQEHMRELRVKEGDFQAEAKWLSSAIEWHAYDCSRSAREFYEAAKGAQKVEKEIGFEEEQEVEGGQEAEGEEEKEVEREEEVEGGQEAEGEEEKEVEREEEVEGGQEAEGEDEVEGEKEETQEQCQARMSKTDRLCLAFISLVKEFTEAPRIFRQA